MVVAELVFFQDSDEDVSTMAQGTHLHLTQEHNVSATEGFYRGVWTHNLMIVRVAIHNIELLYNVGAVVIRIAIHNAHKTD